MNNFDDAARLLAQPLGGLLLVMLLLLQTIPR